MTKKWIKWVIGVIYVVVVGWRGFGWEGWRFVVGNIIAGGLLLIDKLVYVWWLYPFDQLSIQVQYWMRRKDIKAIWGLLTGGGWQQKKLILKSVGFALVWIMLAIYVATSTGSVVAMGIVMGLGFDLGWAILRDWKKPELLAGWYCWQIKRSVSAKEVWWYGGILVGVWVILTARLVWF